MAGADLLLVHDPELLLVLPPRRRRPPTVWDVHEDTAAALTTKSWLPAWLRAVAAGGVHVAEHLAERRLHLLLAENGYNDRFASTHPVVPNTTYVPPRAAPPSGPRRVVYVGWLSPDRGSAEMVELGLLLKPHGIAVELIGQADGAARAHIEAGGDFVHWHGFVPNAEALRLVEGALAGLSLLQDEANFRHSMPTKIAEYMARAVPAVTTPAAAGGRAGGGGRRRLRRPLQRPARRRRRDPEAGRRPGPPRPDGPARPRLRSRPPGLGPATPPPSSPSWKPGPTRAPPPDNSNKRP